MQYPAQVIIYTAAMLLIYLLFLRNRPVYRLSRFYLLASAIVPVLIPFIRLPQGVEQGLRQMHIFEVDLPAITVSASHRISAVQNVIPAIWIVYGIITALFLAWHLWQVLRLRTVIHNSPAEKRGPYTLLTATGYGPGSFGKYIFFPGDEVNETILAHEQAHIRLRHTADIIFVNLMQALFWPNVFLVWLRRELKQVHEFQADATLNADRQHYAQLLLSAVFNTHSVPVMHLFIIHPIKRRIMMLQKKGKASPLKAAILVCSATVLFLAVATAVQSCGKKNDTTAPTATNKAENLSPAARQAMLKTMDSTAETKFDKMAKLHLNKFDPKNKEYDIPDEQGIYGFADKMPTPGYDYNTFISQNIHYPDNARKNGIQGKVVVRFVIDENGNVKNPKCMRSVSPDLDNEALRVVAMLPQWKPGEQDGKKVPVYFYLPIVFSLQ